MANINKLRNISGEAHIIGVAESNKIGKVPDNSFVLRANWIFF